MDDFAALRAKLEGLKGDTLRKAERKSLGAVGDLVKAAIKRRAPSQAGEHAGGRLKPGELAASIKAKVHVATDQGVTTGDTSNVTIGPVGRGVVGIASAVENGHANPRAKRGLKHTPAHPFIRPAFDETQDAAVALYTEVMSEQIAEAME